MRVAEEESSSRPWTSTRRPDMGRVVRDMEGQGGRKDSERPSVAMVAVGGGCGDPCEW